jgi:beta-mannosidase
VADGIQIDGFELTSSGIGAEAPPTGAEWLPATVPGGVHESLLAAAHIDDPYYDRNESRIRWIEERDWWYRTTFAAPPDRADGDRVRLVCHGLDTVATVWVNGERLGRHQNMFRPAEFTVTGLLAERNTLLIRFSPPLSGLAVPPTVADLLSRVRKLFGGGDGDEPAGDVEPSGILSSALGMATLRRKAAFSWGWDFGPRVPSIGVWRPIELIHERGATITGHQVRTLSADPANATAEVAVEVEVDAFGEPADLRASVVLTAPDGSESAAPVELSAGGTGGARLSIADAKLWWTHDLGAPALYRYRIEVRAGDAVLDTVDGRVGLRTIELDRSPDRREGGRLFRFLLNGVPVFARGANWLPASMLVGSVPGQRYRDLVRLARDGNMTMLRVWGGGVYEHDAFYDACDEYGLLVWQDFMFACIDYPDEDPGLREEVTLEAAYQVRRLRNHPSLALWSGNNEVQMLHGMAYGNVEPGNWGYGFFHDILPAAVARHGAGVPYWPGSPYGEDDPAGVNGVRDGDRHAWEVWHGADFGAGAAGTYPSRGEAMHFHRYAEDTGKFISEFGIHAAPELSTLERWIPAEALTVHSESFDHHNKDHPKNKGDDLLEVETGLPKGIAEYVDFTMAAQAEGIKFGVEHYRRRQPHANGTLIWQFNDVWPGFSWSIVDYDLVPKAGYYYAKRAFAPILASFRRAADGRLELWVANSTADYQDVRATVQIGTFTGETLLEREVVVSAPPATGTLAWTSPGPVAGMDRYAWVSTPDGLFPDNRAFFVPVKRLPVGTAELTVETAAAGDGAATVDITARGYAYFAHVLSPAPGVRFSDNYLDLRDGQSVRIRVDGLPDGFDPADLRVATYAS